MIILNYSLLIVLLNISFSLFAQDLSRFKAPEKIPKKIKTVVNKRAMEILNSSKLEKLTISFLEADDIYQVEFIQNNELVYYDAKTGKTLPETEVKASNIKSYGTQNIPLGWFRDQVNFYGSSEQPYHQIYIAESRTYWEFNVRGVSWGYSSHHFETNIWSDCYGEYTHTTQKITLYKKVISGGTIHLYPHVYSGVEANYYGDYFSGTSTAVDNNATDYKVEFKINFVPSYVSGANILCSNQQSTFTFHNNSYGGTPYWTKSSNLELVNKNGNYYTVKPKYSWSIGTAWVQMNVCNGDATFRKEFWLGKPSYTLSGDTELETLEQGIADINYTGNSHVTNVSWTRSGAISSVTGSTVIGRYRAGSQPGYGNVYANITNTCGSVQKNLLVNVTGGWHKAYPNPVNDVLTLELDQEKMPANLKSEKVEIRLYDKMANLKKMKSFHGHSTTINMYGLKPDVYLLQIRIGDKIVEEKIIVSER